jgi:hypothetical protein
VVDRGEIVGDLRGRQLVVHEDTDVQQGLGCADLPAVPVAVAGLVLVVDLGVEVIEAGQDVVAERRPVSRSARCLAGSRPGRAC